MPFPRMLARLCVDRLEARDLPAASFESFPTFNFSDPAVLDTARAIAVRGGALGRRADVFMKVGDSNSSPEYGYGPGYLLPLGAAGYNATASGLALLRPDLLDTLAVYRGTCGFNSFARLSTAAFAGATTGQLLPVFGGELAATNAGVALIMIGTNEPFVGTDPEVFRANLRTLTDTLAAAGVVPVLSTVPENLYDRGRFQGSARQVNQVIADVAEDDHLPLWNLWGDLRGLPLSGLDRFGVHLSASPAGGGNFTEPDLQYGQNVRNLKALEALDWFREQVVGGTPEVVALLPTWTPLAVGQTVYAVGRGEGQGPAVSVFDTATGAELNRFNAFDPAFAGGVRVAVADVTGDGVPDVVAAPGPGGGPVVKVFSGADGALVANFFAFDPAFRGGVGSIDAADGDGDGVAEIAVGAGRGGGPVVAVFRGGDFAEVRRFFAFDPMFRGGVHVALGTFAGAGPAVVATPGPGGGPVVGLFAFGSMTPVRSFFGGDLLDQGGIVVAAGDFDGDGFDEVATGSDSGTPLVRVFDPVTGAERTRFTTGSSGSRVGVRLATLPGEPGEADELLVGPGPGGAVSVSAFDVFAGGSRQLAPDDRTRAYGVYVG